MKQPITIDIPHQLGVAEARRRIDQGFDSLLEQISGRGLVRTKRAWDGDWMSFSVSVLGQGVTGQLLVTGDMVRMEVELPGFLSSLASAIQARVQNQGRLLLEKK